MITIPLIKYGVLIPILNALSTFPLFTVNKTDLSAQELPFFEKYDLLVARTFSTIPPVTMHYLWNQANNKVIKLDGTRDAVFANLSLLKPVINEQTAVAYVQFVLDNVQSEEGTLRLVESVEDIEFSDTPTDEEMQYLKEHVFQAQVTKSAANYHLTCMVIYGTTLYETNLILEPSGLFQIVNEVPLDGSMPCLRPLFLE